MKKYLDRDQIAGVFLIILGIAYYRAAVALPRSLVSDRVGAAGFPKLLALTLIILSGVLILQSVLRKLSHPDQGAPENDKSLADFGYAAGMLGLGVGYLIIVSHLGYLLSIALLLAAALRYQREPLSVKVFVTAILGGVLFWGFFVFALKTPMPSGVWAAILGGS